MERQRFWFFNESYGEPACSTQYTDYYGFCEKHTVRALSKGPKWQKSVIYDWIIKARLPEAEQLLKTIKAIKPARNPIIAKRNRTKLEVATGRVKPNGSCLFCRSIEQTERYYMNNLLKCLRNPMIKEAYRVSDGICLKHYFLAIEFVDLEYIEGLRGVTELLLRKLGELKKDFEEFFRKSDYRFAREPKGDEQTAWLRAIRLFLGGTEGIRE